MPDVQQIIDGLGCFTTQHHPCIGCPYNPHPGMAWAYGCIKGQVEIVQDAREKLLAQEERIAELEKTHVTNKKPEGKETYGQLAWRADKWPETRP